MSGEGQRSRASEVPYELAYDRYHPGVSVMNFVYISPEDATEEKIRALTDSWRERYSEQPTLWLSIFTDPEMAELSDEYLSDGGLSPDLEAAYNKAWVAAYTRTPEAGIDTLLIHLGGRGIEETVVNY